MKPLILKSEDNEALLTLGRASVQIVHDLKNQLNGLKLYATFLRKRLEKNGHASDELETVQKLMSGLDKTADDLSLIVEYGRPLELKKQSNTDLEKIVREVAASAKESVNGNTGETVTIKSESVVGAFDAAALARALKAITSGAIKRAKSKRPDAPLQISLKSEDSHGVIEWSVFDAFDHNPFESFAGSDEIRFAVAARIIEAHGGAANYHEGSLRVKLPTS